MRRDFHARARFALSTSCEEKRGLLVVYGKAVSSIGDGDQGYGLVIGDRGLFFRLCFFKISSALC